MKPQEMIDVIQAHADGKQLQMRPKEDAMWIDCKPPSPMFDFAHYEYRIKPVAPAKWQYYRRNDECFALDANDDDCKCWFDEGTGPLPDAKRDFTNLNWRPAKQPAPVALRPHWPALQRTPWKTYVIGATLFAEARDACTTDGFIRLATEYPPVMLP